MPTLQIPSSRFRLAAHVELARLADQKLPNHYLSVISFYFHRRTTLDFPLDDSKRQLIEYLILDQSLKRTGSEYFVDVGLFKDLP